MKASQDISLFVNPHIYQTAVGVKAPKAVCVSRADENASDAAHKGVRLQPRRSCRALQRKVSLFLEMGSLDLIRPEYSALLKLAENSGVLSLGNEHHRRGK